MLRWARAAGWRNWGYLAASLGCFAAIQWGDAPGLGPDKAPVAMTTLMLWLIGTGGFVLGNLIDLVLALLQRRRPVPAIIGALLPTVLVALGAALA